MNGQPEVPTRFPLSPAQRDLLLESGAGSQAVATSFALGADVDLDRWQAAAHEVFQAEPGMRLRLVAHEGGWWQELDGAAHLHTHVVQLDDTTDVTTWVRRHLEAPDALEADRSFVHALLQEPCGQWHAVAMAPHVFADGQAFRVFFERTARAYEDGTVASTPIADLFRAHERTGAGMDQPETLAHWREQLRTVAPLAFRTSRESPGTDVDQSTMLPLDQSTAVEDFCHEHGLHPADFFLAVYAIVLERFREREGAFVVHTIRSTRGLEEAELVGCFYRALPMVLRPADLTVSTPVSDLLARLVSQRLEPRERMRISMLALQEFLPRGSARAVFNYYNFTNVNALGGDRQLRSYFLHRPDELHLVVARRPDGFELRTRFNTSTLTDLRLLPRLAAVAAQIAGGAARIGDCDWLLPHEQAVPRPAPATATPATAEGLIAAHARRQPDATALILGERHLTYRALDAAANRLAHRLIREGVGPDTLVGVHLDRSFEQVAAILGILKAGGAFVPIDPDYPEERSLGILADSRVPVLVGRLPAGESAVACTCLAFDDVGTSFADESEEPPPAHASVDDLAYVIYTSGSTGRPKGTLVTRRNLASLLEAARPVYDFGSSDTWTLLHSCAFDFSVWETFGALATGGRLVIVPTDVARSQAELARLIDRDGVTVLNQTPSAFYHLAAAPELTGATLRYVIFGGEALETRRLAGWFARFGDRTPLLVNMYGITETTVHVTHQALSHADAATDASPIGRPLAGWDIQLMDPEARAVPHGCSGEIWVGGAGVARGYLNREELTRERFVDDPLRPGSGRRLYRSGDLARAGNDGELQFLGRLDDQVKIRGYRVELGEVAAVLTEHPTVQDAVVVAQAGPEGAVLVGYAIPARDVPFDEAALLRYLRRRLPPYMACSRVVPVPAFPLTAHGKLDRRALPAPTGRAPEAAQFLAPRTATEELVASLFAEATGSARVGVDDNFFTIGGHSLAAMRVATRLREVFQVRTSAALIFERQTVGLIAEYVAGHQGTADAQDAPRFDRQPRRDALPCTFAQERVLLLQRLFPEMLAYNFEAALTFRGRLEPALLARALAHLVERHDAFRTTFHEDNGRPFQRVHDRGVVSFQQLDCSNAAPEDATRLVEQIRRQTSDKPFDPARLPLVDWCLVKVSPSQHVLLHREHHLTHDGWSFVVFIRELLDLYRAYAEGREAHLPACVQVGDYAAAHRRWLDGPAGAQQRAYWVDRLAGIPERLDLPTDRPRPAVFSFRGDQLRFDLPDELVTRLRTVASREGLTLYMVLVGAFSLVLSRLSGSEDLAVAAGSANRRWEETERTIGMLLNNVVFRFKPRGEVSGREYLHEVRAGVLGAMANQDLPFDEIVKAAGVQRSPSETPLAKIFFSSYEGPLPDLDLPELDVEFEAGLPNGSAKFDWNVIVFTRPGEGDGQRERVTVLWEYATDLFERKTIERARRQFLAAVDWLLENLDRPLADASISDAEERRFLLEAAEGARSPYPRDASIHELFARQVAARGNAVAVRAGQDTVTYAELDRRADAVARELLARGVAAEEPVAFLLPRGIGAIATMLGIVKAGAAYVPLSLRDPRARVARLVADAGARIVVTDDADSTVLDGVGARVLALDTVLSQRGQPVHVETQAGSLAAVLFTSGSTGQPKGVEVLHRGIVRLLFGVDYATLGPEERILQLAPLSFDASTLEIWGALLHGGETVVFPEDLPSASALGDAIAQYGITTMWLNASLFNAVVDENASALAPLRQLLVGGEALSPVHVARARQHAPRTTLINGYGPTENTTFSCCYPLPADMDAAGPIPIGRPIAHSTARVLDTHRRLAPAGAVGEIYVGGDGLARGYRRREALTAEAFVTDPLASTPGARLYRTGDLGRVRPDGTLEFHGRRDAQLKIRGFRIEPGEIEGALCRVAGVAAASVQAVPEAARGTTLVAFVVPEKDAALLAGDVLRTLAADLPPYLLPSRVIVRQSLPVTAHGKLDVALLGREALQVRIDADVLPAALPQTALEGVVATVFADVLGCDKFPADQDFFDAGGHSLLVLRVLARLDRALGVHVEPSLFLQGPTPRQLAEKIERQLNDRPETRPTGTGKFLVRVSSGERPLLFIPGGEGGDLSLAVYARLALHMPGTAFYGLRLMQEDRQLGGGATSVEALAAAAIDDILQIQPDGHIDLVGGCIGGIVAYEIARQLEASGRTPRSLVLLDTTYPSLRRQLSVQGRGLSTSVRRRTREWLRASRLPQSQQDWLYSKISRLMPYREGEASALVPMEWIRFIGMVLSYRPKPMRVPALLLATKDLVDQGSPRQWTEALGDRMMVRDLPGTHWSFMRTDIAQTGATLRQFLPEQ